MNSNRENRRLKVRVKTGKGRSLSSKLWLERQLNDPYVARARREGLRSRAAFKLAEIDDKHHLLRSGARVVDLGAAPGGWSQVVAKRVGERGRVVAIDVLDMEPIPGVAFARIEGEGGNAAGLEVGVRCWPPDLPHERSLWIDLARAQPGGVPVDREPEIRASIPDECALLVVGIPNPFPDAGARSRVAVWVEAK